MFSTISSLLPLFMRVVGLLLVTYYLFSIIGMAAFGGKIYQGAPGLNETAFGQQHYEALNFNDFPSSMVTLFVLQVVNNWNVVMSGYLAVTNRWAILFFVLFWLLVVVITLNLVVAFVTVSVVTWAKSHEYIAFETKQP